MEIEMKPTSVEKVKEFDDLVIYKTNCECGDHVLTFTLEFEKDLPWLTLCLNMSTPYHYRYYRESWYSHLFYRFYNSIRLFFGYPMEYEDSFLFKDEQHIQDFIDALKDGIEHVKSKKKNFG